MKKDLKEFEDKMIAKATEEFSHLTGIKDLYGMHSSVYSFISELIDLGKHLNEMEKFEYTFPDREEK